MSKQCPDCGRRYADPLIFCADDGARLEDDPLIGRRISGREILRFIGEGGAGALFLAEHVELQRDEALKLLHPSYAQERQFVNRFLQEARIIAKLKSPHTVRLFDFGRTNDGLIFILMEFLRGQTLQAILFEEPKMAPRRAARIVMQICDALGEAHAAHIIHRDIKPANIMVEMIGERPHARVLDFGVARARGPDTCKTVPGQFVGTPAFSSPEQALGEAHIDGRSDLYALGVLFYRMLAGQNPFEVPNNWIETLKRQAGWTPPLLGDGVPPELAHLVAEMLAKMPEDRPADAEAVAQRLRAFLERAEGAPPTPPPSRVDQSVTRARLSAERAALEARRVEVEALAADLKPRQAALKEREAALSTEREALRTQRRELDGRAEELASLEETLEARAVDLEARSVGFEAREIALLEREAEMEAREAALRAREARAEVLFAREAEVEARAHALEGWARRLEVQSKHLEGGLEELEGRLGASVEAQRALQKESREEWARINTHQAQVLELRAAFEGLFLRAEGLWDQLNEDAAARFNLDAGLEEEARHLDALRRDVVGMKERASRRATPPTPPRPTPPPEIEASAPTLVNLEPGWLPDLRHFEGAQLPPHPNAPEDDPPPIQLSPYALAKAPLPQGAYAALMGLAPGPDPKRPARGLAFRDAVRCANQLSQREGLRPCYTLEGDEIRWERSADGFRLPTEAEWRYAESVDLAPDPAGLWIWCWDYAGAIDPNQTLDPIGPEEGHSRILRGGRGRRARKPEGLGHSSFGVVLARGALVEAETHAARQRPTLGGESKSLEAR